MAIEHDIKAMLLQRASLQHAMDELDDKIARAEGHMYSVDRAELRRPLTCQPLQ